MELRIQAVLLDHPRDRVRLSSASIASAARRATEQGLVDRVVVRFGDAGQRPWTTAEWDELLAGLPSEVEVTRTRFEDAPGYSEAHNRLAENGGEDLLMIVHPEAVLAPDTIAVLVGELGRPVVGIVDAKQIPLEHPKYFDPVTGETSWVSGVCLLLRSPLFDELGRFDADSFHAEGADVDLSWRVRERGLTAVTQNAATAFTDARVDPVTAQVHAASAPSYPARARLLLAHKWSRPDRVSRMLEDWSSNGGDERRAAADEFRRRLAAGTLPAPRDPDHLIGHFEGGDYADLRFRLTERTDHAH